MSHQIVPADFADFVASRAFPCVGAKSALALGHLATFEAGDIACARDDHAIHAALSEFGDSLSPHPSMQSFACLFATGQKLSDAAFESLLWKRLQALHDIDARAHRAWARGVASDPVSPHFSMSIGGAAYFVVGLHPGASRPARRFSRPALVFNPHAQFEALRADGRYAALQAIVREREQRVSGGVNPMLADFGEEGRGEAAQYSGRLVGDDWVCPLKVRT